MAKHIETGKKGEQLAREYLEKKGYRILETNWRHSRAEIDIIAKEEEVLVFIEVKTRSYDTLGKPEEFVTPHKEQLMVKAASVYMEKINHDWEIRFDIIAIIIPDKGEPVLQHIEDAFFPGLE
ncbi:MAG: YraN family protein [Bacteroidetes bacterium]|nr:YraN family protein [Bacteroidota bacterium]